MIENLFYLLGVIGIVVIVFWYLQNREIVVRGGVNEEVGEAGHGLLAMKDEQEKSKDGDES